MSKEDFTKNNRGINDGKDLPPDFLSFIYDNILSEEIRMKDELEAAMLATLPTSGSGLAGTLANVGRDLQKEAYVMQSTSMVHKTEVRSNVTANCSPSDLQTRSPIGVIQDYDEGSTERKSFRSILQRLPFRPCPTYVRSGMDAFLGWSFRPASRY